MVLGAVLVMLILITGVIGEPSYLSVTGLRNSALFAAPLGIDGGWVR